MEEKEIVVRMQNGDEQAFYELYERYKDSLFHTACLICGNQADGEDVLQETFVTAFYHCRELKKPEMWKYWLFQIMRRKAFEVVKKKKREIPEEKIIELADENFAGQSELEILEQEERHVIWKVIEKLPIKQKTIIILFYFNDMSVTQISKIMECSEGTVKSRLFLARNRLKKILTEEIPDISKSVV